MITAEDRETYTTGNCYNLALAIHEITGWQLVISDYTGIWGEEVHRYADYVGICPDHAWVMTPDGSKLDIEGLAEWDEMAIETEAVEPEQVEVFVWRKCCPERTRALAEYLVEAYSRGDL